MKTKKELKDEAISEMIKKLSGIPIDDLKKTVRAKGIIVDYGNELCQAYKHTHINCFGCRSEKGCLELIKLIKNRK